MSKVDRWLLPDGIEEVLPSEANKLEELRRVLINLYQRWGYDYVIPPMVEFIDSLLTGSGEKASIDTFKVTDQISGRTMGIRADITPQAARMDAHSLKRDGINRLCYAGHVMFTKPKSPLASRTPVQAGVELFGESTLDADKETISLLLETLKLAGLPEIYIDIGHVGVYRTLIEAAGLSQDQEDKYFALLQAKSTSGIDVWVSENITDNAMASWLRALPTLAGDQTVLENARRIFADAPKAVMLAIDELTQLYALVQRRYPESKCYFDLGELRGYHYYTGIIFGAFAPGLGEAIANGGRYDRVGESFGRARPATGFTVNLTSMSRICTKPADEPAAIFVSSNVNAHHWQEIDALRAKGERVIVGLADQAAPYAHQNCDREVIESKKKVLIQALT